jgi:hypothetical protein
VGLAFCRFPTSQGHFAGPIIFAGFAKNFCRLFSHSGQEERRADPSIPDISVT